MGLPDLKVPHRHSYDFGIGTLAQSGSPRHLAVEGEPTGVGGAPGASQTFSVTQVSTSTDLSDKLGIDIGASYGVGCFGAGISARFGMTSESRVQSASLFMSVVCTIELETLSIDRPRLTDEAAGFVGRPEIFHDRYGDMFCRACTRGGLFVGVIQIDTESSAQSSDIATELKGSYGMFNAAAKVNFQKVLEARNVKSYCTMHSEGGPQFDVRHPESPGALLDYANHWFEAFHTQPNLNARPTGWLLSPMSIAEAPTPNTADITHAQDVLRFCARERNALLDKLNLFGELTNNDGRFNWTGEDASREEVAAAFANVQADIDILGDCASVAMNDVKKARMPAVFDPRYRTALLPAKLPQPKPGQKCTASRPQGLTDAEEEDRRRRLMAIVTPVRRIPG